MTSGDPIYRGMNISELDVQYDARGTVDDIAPFLAQYADLSAAAKRDLEVVEDIPFGPGADTAMHTSLDPLADDVINDPYPFLARARKDSPVAYCEPINMWLVTRHKDVEEVFLDPKRFSASIDALCFGTVKA